MKIAILGDLHWGVRGGDPVFMDFQFKWFEYFLNTCRDKGVHRVIQVGDWFDVRKNTNNLLIHRVLKEASSLIDGSGMDWIKVRGNHETFYRDNNEVGADILLEEFCNVRVVKEWGEEDDCLFVGWMNKTNSESLLKKISESNAKYCFGHFEPVGMPMYKGVPATHGMDTAPLDKFKRVFSGHYHTVSTHKNFTMVGSPYHLTWADFPDGTNRGFFILDTDTDAVEFVKNNESQSLFDVIEYDPTVKYEGGALDQYAGKLVKVLVESKEDPKHFKKFKQVLDSTKFIDYSVVDMTIVENKAVSIDLRTLEVNPLNVFHKYIRAQDGVEADDLVTLSTQIYEKAVSL